MARVASAGRALRCRLSSLSFGQLDTVTLARDLLCSRYASLSPDKSEMSTALRGVQSDRYRYSSLSVLGSWTVASSLQREAVSISRAVQSESSRAVRFVPSTLRVVSLVSPVIWSLVSGLRSSWRLLTLVKPERSSDFISPFCNCISSSAVQPVRVTLVSFIQEFASSFFSPVQPVRSSVGIEVRAQMSSWREVTPWTCRSVTPLFLTLSFSIDCDLVRSTCESTLA